MTECSDQCPVNGEEGVLWAHSWFAAVGYLEELLFHFYHTYLEDIFLFIHAHYLDVYYFGWLAWVFWPLVITFVLPSVLLLLVYGSALFLQVYRLRHHIKDAYAMDPWTGARQMLCVFWDAQGHLWHGESIFQI